MRDYQPGLPWPPENIDKVHIVIGVDGTKDIYRPGSILFGTLAPIPPEVAAELGGILPAVPIPETGWPPSVRRARRARVEGA